MYRAKAAWKGRSEVFDANMRNQVIERMHLDTALRHIVPVLGDEPEIDHAHATATQVAPAPPFVYEPEILAPVTAEELTELITTGQPLAEPTAWADSLIETESTAVTVESIARANINQAVGVTLTDGRSFSTKILAVIVHPGAKPLVLVKGWAYESGDFNPFAVVKYPLAQVADIYLPLTPGTDIVNSMMRKPPRKAASIASAWIAGEERQIEREILRDMRYQIDKLRAEIVALRAESRAAAHLQAEERETLRRHPR